MAPTWAADHPPTSESTTIWRSRAGPRHYRDRRCPCVLSSPRCAPTPPSNGSTWPPAPGSMSCGASSRRPGRSTTTSWRPPTGSRAASSATSAGSTSPASGPGARSTAGPGTRCSSTRTRWLTHRYRVRFDGYALAWYRDGRDSQAFHRDRELRYLDDTVIAVLSLGARRPWLLRPRAHRDRHDLERHGATHDLAPGPGDLLVMGGRCQADFEHSVPKVHGAARRSRLGAVALDVGPRPTGGGRLVPRPPPVQPLTGPSGAGALDQLDHVEHRALVVDRRRRSARRGCPCPA